MIFKMTCKHAEDCCALVMCERGDWDSPWWMPGSARWLDSSGRRQGGKGGNFHRWHVLRCNETTCNGAALLREDAILMGTEWK